MKRKIAVTLATGMLLATGATACAPTDTAAPSGGETGSGSKGTLAFYTDKAAWKPDFEKLNQDSEPEIGIDLKVTGYSDSNQYDAFIKQSFRTTQSPGLFTWHTGDNLVELVNDGLIAETTDIWADAVDQGWISTEVRDAYTVDGKQYCVPMNVAYWVMFYNKQIFEDNGLAEPTSFTELTETVEVLKDAGIPPIYQTTFLFTFPWFEHLVASTDPSLWYGLQDGSVSFTDPELIEIGEIWKEQQDAGWFNDAGSSVDPALGLKQGDYAMIPFGTFYAGNLAGAGVTEDEYGMFLIPAVNEKLDKTPVAFETGPLCVAEQSDQRELGLEYSRWWMSPEAQTAWNAAHGDVAFNPQAEVAQEGLREISEKVNAEALLYDRFIEAMPTSVVTAGDEQFSAFIANPGDPVEFLSKIQAAAEKHWNSKG